MADAYADRAVTLKTAIAGDPLPPGRILSSATMPSLLAAVLEEVLPLPAMRVLQIGTGPGYLAALLAELVGDSGHVVTVEIDAALSEAARTNLRDSGYKHVHCVSGDGYLGYAPEGPYDRILATASCAEVPASWTDQLKADGILVLPLSLSQRASYYPMLAFKKDGSRLRGTVVPGLGRVGFLPLYGPNVVRPVLYERATSELELAMDPHLLAASHSRSQLDGLRLVAVLEIAKRAAADWDTHRSWDPGAIAWESIAAWQEERRPTTAAFEFSLMSKGDKPIHHRWHYPKDDYDLLVSVNVK